MADQEFISALDRTGEVDLTVVGRRTGRESTRPVWFVREDGVLYLVPIYGVDSEWYKNLLKTPAIRLRAGGREVEASATPVTEPERVAAIRDAFRAKYGSANFEQFYPKPDAAVEVRLD